jgi:hypothetical protein
MRKRVNRISTKVEIHRHKTFTGQPWIASIIPGGWNRPQPATPWRHGRSMACRAEMETVRGLASFLVTDCRGGGPEICEPLVAEITPCCTPKEAKDV